MVFSCTQLQRRLCEVAAHSAESDHGRLKIEGRLCSISIEILLLLRCVLTSLHRLYSAAVEKSACTLLIKSVIEPFAVARWIHRQRRYQTS